MSVARAVLFDLDGTLVDSADDIAIALARAMADHGLGEPARSQVRGWIGGGARNLVASAVEPALVEPVLAAFRVHYAAAPVVHTHVYAGLDTVLDRIAASAAIAVVTNKPHELAVAIAGRVLARWPFAVILGQREGQPIKPRPEPALEAAALLGVAPDACAFVGDSGVDVDTARAAGMRAVAVTWGYRPRAELAGADLVVDDVAGLLALI